MVDKNILVSIIVPVYNVEDYIDQCIERIVDQTYSNLEIILIDDGSTDDSGKIIDNWAKKDSRITVVHQENAGLSAARNIGIVNSHGKWLSFIDSDDYVSPKYIEVMLSAANTTKAQLVISNYSEVDETTNAIGNIKHNPVGIYNVRKFWTLFYSKKSNIVPLVVSWNKLYMRDIFNNIKFKPNIINEDEEIIYSIIKNAKKIAIISNSLYYYRINRDGSIMNNINNTVIRKSIYDIYNFRIRKMYDDGLYDIAHQANSITIFNLINEYSLNPTLTNKSTLVTKLKLLKDNTAILRENGVKVSFKEIVYSNFPFLVSKLKILRRKIKLYMRGLYAKK